MERKRIDPESDDYKAWKQGAVSLEEEPVEVQEGNSPEENKGLIHWFFYGDLFSPYNDNSEEGNIRASILYLENTSA